MRWGRAGAVEVVLGAALSPCPGPGRSGPCGTLLCVWLLFTWRKEAHYLNREAP